MKESDFDHLTGGATAEEARRLRKLLTEWARGDENSFPVQLALLTRSQWRAAGHLPKLLETERQALADLLAQAKGDTRAAAQGVQDAMRASMKALQTEIGEHSTDVKMAAATIGGRLTHSEAIAREIRRTLEDGRQVWDDASRSFMRERQALADTVDHARKQFEHEVSMGVLSSWALILLIGIVIGSLVTYRVVVRYPVVQMAPASQPSGPP